MRCQKRKQPCPGYREETNIVFQDQNKWAKQKVLKRIGFDSRKVSEDDTVSEVSRLSTQPYIDPSVFAIDCFYNDYVVKQGCFPFLDFLPDMYATGNKIACFQQALPAVALASVAQQMHHHDLLLESKRRYGRALRALSSAIQVPKTAKSDEVLTTVFLLGLFEV
jgi:hypothetical protein